MFPLGYGRADGRAVQPVPPARHCAAVAAPVGLVTDSARHGSHMQGASFPNGAEDW
jgi:hypothetical protein